MNTKFPLISTPRFLLRQIISTDIENIYRGLSHPDVIKYYGVKYSSLEETKAQMLFYKELEKKETGIWWAICTKDTGQFCGTIGYTYLNKVHRNAELGFWLFPEYWRQGILSELGHPVCSFAFKNLKLHRISAYVETDNLGSRKVLQKLNFTHEGTLRECEIKDGKFISLDVFSKLNSDIIPIQK